jgi:hypothetical protein
MALFAFVLINVGKYTGLNITASIRTDFADGVRMYTSNSRTHVTHSDLAEDRRGVLPRCDGRRGAV